MASPAIPIARKRIPRKKRPTSTSYEGMRYRDLETGTFLTRDPIGYGDGPNVYCYVHCNPITHFDPLGLSGWEEGFGVINSHLDRNGPEYRSEVESLGAGVGLGVGSYVPSVCRGVDQLTRGAGLQGAKEKRRFDMETVIIIEGINQLLTDNNTRSLARSAVGTLVDNFKGSSSEKQAEMVGKLAGRQGTSLVINITTKSGAGTALLFLANYGDARAVLSDTIEKYTLDVLGKILDEEVLTPEDIAGFLGSDLGQDTMETVLEMIATGSESEDENQEQNNEKGNDDENNQNNSSTSGD